MISNFNYLNKKKQIFILTLVVCISLLLRIFLSSLTLGGADAVNVYIFDVWSYNQYDIYSLFFLPESLGSPPPYLPFTKFFWNFFGWMSEFFNVSFHFSHKLIATLFDLFTGILILNYLKKKNIKNYFLIFLLYIFNPLSLYITTVLSFIDSIVIFLLVACCYLYDQKEKNYDLIAILLTISFITKAYTLCFVPFFFINCPKKIRFFTISIFTALFFNSFYLNSENFYSIIKILEYIFTKIKSGHSLSDHGFGLFAKLIEYQNLNYPVLKISKSIALVLLIILNLFFVKKIHSIKFIFFTFFILYFFMPNIHFQYFYWIVPFIFLYKFNLNSLLFCFGFFLLAFIHSLNTAVDDGINSGLFVFSFLNNFVSEEILDLKIGFKGTISLILIFYICLLINFKTNLKIIFTFLKNNKNNFNLFDTIFKNSNLFQINYFKSYAFLILFIIIFVFNYSDLYKTNNAININYENINTITNKIKNPNYFINFNKYGTPITIDLELHFNKNNKKSLSNLNQLKILVDSNEFYVLKVNDAYVYNGYGLSFAENLFQNKKYKIIPKINTHKINYSEGNILRLSITYNYFSLKKTPPFKLYLQDDDKKINWKDSKFKCYNNEHKGFCKSKKINNIIETTFVIKDNKDLLKNSTIIFLIFLILILINLYLFYFYKTVNKIFKS